jgi:ribosomal protein S18 acetylase RimI-like enzyme
MSNFVIEKASFEDMDFILALAKGEGWNPGLDDAGPFFNTDPNGFFIGKIAEKKIGCISTVAYTPEFGFLGLYIVVPEYRGRGFGLQLWNHAINYLGTRCIGLDGVIAQQENYKKSNFQLYYRNIRFEGIGGGIPSNSLTDLLDIPFGTLLEYDFPIFGVSRNMFLEKWIHMQNAQSLGKVSNDQLVGFGVIRKCSIGYKIGPLFADNIDIAEEIYSSLCAKAENAAVFLDVPETNQQAMHLVENVKLKKSFETARMYNKAPPKQLISKIFGITSFELG